MFNISMFLLIVFLVISDEKNDDEENIKVVSIVNVASERNYENINKQTLQMASILFHNANHNPIQLYPNDPHISYDWPGGLGALTKKGALQAYNLGKHLNLRYHSLLPKNYLYTKKDIHVLSSAVECCLMSAASVLAGLMPPDKKNILPILWQPIPINSLSISEDNILASTKPCKKYMEILDNFADNPPPDLKQLNDYHKDLFKILTKFTGKNIRNITDVQQLHNTLDIEEAEGLQLPYWTENIYPDKTIPLFQRSFQFVTETSYMKKVKSGPYLTEVLTHMKAKRDNNLKPDRKLFIYSAHDVNLVNVMNSLQILNQTSTKPEYSSCFGIELHHNLFLDQDYEVKLIYYESSETQVPIEISIPNCEKPCSLNKFEKSIQNLIVYDYDEICENNK